METTVLTVGPVSLSVNQREGNEYLMVLSMIHNITKTMTVLYKNI